MSNSHTRISALNKCAKQEFIHVEDERPCFDHLPMKTSTITLHLNDLRSFHAVRTTL